MPIARKCMLMPRYDRYFYLTCRMYLIAMEYIQLRRSLGLYTVYLPQVSTRPYAIVTVSELIMYLRPVPHALADPCSAASRKSGSTTQTAEKRP